MTNTDPTATTVELTVGRETRTVALTTFGGHGPDLAERAYIFGVVATIGNGVARYPAEVMLWALDRHPNARGTKVTDSAGRVWAYGLNTTVRNRQARLVGWTDTVGATNSTRTNDRVN